MRSADDSRSDAWPASVGEQDEYKQFRWLLEEERAEVEAKVGKLGSMQFASALLMGLASTFIGQVSVPYDGSMNDGIIVAFALFAVLTLCLHMIALILSSLISIAVLNHDTKSCLKHELGWLDEGHAADGNSHLPASPMAAALTTASHRCRYPKLNPDDNASVAFESPFRRFWNLNCESDLVLAFRFFVAGLVSFLISVIFTTIVQFRVAAGAWYIAILVASTALIWVCVSLLPQWSGAAKSSEAPPLLLDAYPRRWRR